MSGCFAVATTAGIALAQAPMTSNEDASMAGGDPMAMGAMMESSTTFDRKDLDFFEAKIRPLLLGRCLNCHSDDGSRVRAGLRLDTHDQFDPETIALAEAEEKGGDKAGAHIENCPSSIRVTSLKRLCAASRCARR